MPIQKIERFQSDVKKYKDAIENMVDGQSKLDAKKLLNNLIYEVKQMDDMYMDMVYSKQLGSSGNDMREKILSIRKTLDSIIK